MKSPCSSNVLSTNIATATHQKIISFNLSGYYNSTSSYTKMLLDDVNKLPEERYSAHTREKKALSVKKR